MDKYEYRTLKKSLEYMGFGLYSQNIKFNSSNVSALFVACIKSTRGGVEVRSDEQIRKAIVGIINEKRTALYKPTRTERKQRKIKSETMDNTITATRWNMVIRCSVNNASTFFFFYYIKMCARAHYSAMQFTGEYYFIFSCARAWRVRALWRVKNPREVIHREKSTEKDAR